MTMTIALTFSWVMVALFNLYWAIIYTDAYGQAITFKWVAGGFFTYGYTLFGIGCLIAALIT